MRLFLDTNILIFLTQKKKDENISNEMRRLLTDYGNALYTSTVCVHEYIHLCQIGKLRIGKRKAQPLNPNEIFMLLDKLDIHVVPVSNKHFHEYANLPLWKEHTDPNDRLIIAQAISDKISLVSSDQKFNHYKSDGLQFVFNKR